MQRQREDALDGKKGRIDKPVERGYDTKSDRTFFKVPRKMKPSKGREPKKKKNRATAQKEKEDRTSRKNLSNARTTPSTLLAFDRALKNQFPIRLLSI